MKTTASRIALGGLVVLTVLGGFASGTLTPARAGSCDDDFNEGDLTIPMTSTTIAPHSPALADESGPVSGPLANGVTIQATGDKITPQNPVIDGRTGYLVHKTNCDVVVAQVESNTGAINGTAVGIETIGYGVINGTQDDATVVKLTSWVLCVVTTRTVCPVPTIP